MIDTALVRELAETILEMEDKRRKRSEERIYGREAIAAEIGCDVKTMMKWVRTNGLPLEKDPKGYYIVRWTLERWRNAHTRHIDIEEREKALAKAEAKRST